MRLRAVSTFVVGILLGASWQIRASARDTLAVPPESVGFSANRLGHLDEVIRRAVDQGEYAGAVVILARHGKVVYSLAYGQQDLAAGERIKEDTIFRLFSMTKPITAAAMMILYEEGKWSPQEPISKFVPQFKGLKVYSGTDHAGTVLVEEARHPPTMLELMSMTAGFTYGLDSNPVDKMYRDDQDRNIFFSGSLPALIERVARAPLLYQPGSRWVYSVSADIQGYIIEKLSGMTLPEFMRRRLFEPLGMTDTSFYVSREKQTRLASIYKMSDENTLRPTDEVRAFGYQYDKPPSLPLGGAGLVSTARDFFRFAQMLNGRGEVDGIRILGPRTVELMTENHLADDQMKETRGGGYEFNKPRPGMGYGFDAAVVVDPGVAGVPVGKGTYFWDGAGGTWFWSDPTYDIVCVGMVQRWGWGVAHGVPGLPTNLEQLSMATAYQALLRPEPAHRE